MAAAPSPSGPSGPPPSPARAARAARVSLCFSSHPSSRSTFVKPLASLWSTLSHEDRARVRAVNPGVAGRAVPVLDGEVVRRAGGLRRADVVGHTVAGQAELRDRRRVEHPRVRGAVRRVARRAALGLDGRVLEGERPLLLRVALDAGRVHARREPALLGLEAAVRVVAVGALHRALQHLVVEGLRELVLLLGVALEAELLLAALEHLGVLEARLLGVGRGDERVRGGPVRAGHAAVGRVAVGAAHVVAPVLAADEVAVLLAARVAVQTRVGDLHGGLALERPYLRLVAAAVHVRLARAVARLAADNLPLPALLVDELGVGGPLELLVPVLVTGRAGLAPDVVVGIHGGDLLRLRRLLLLVAVGGRRRAEVAPAGAEQQQHPDDPGRNQRRLQNLKSVHLLFASTSVPRVLIRRSAPTPARLLSRPR